MILSRVPARLEINQTSECDSYWLEVPVLLIRKVGGKKSPVLSSNLVFISSELPGFLDNSVFNWEYSCSCFPPFCDNKLLRSST